MKSATARASGNTTGVKLVAESRRTRKRTRFRQRYALWYFLLPAACIYIFIILVPSARSIELGFTNWNGVSPTAKFIGLTNFINIFRSPVAIGSIIHTATYAISITVIQNFIGLLLALGLQSKVKSRNILRALFFAPVLIMPVAAGFLWQYLLGPYGPVNATLNAMGLHSLTRDWLGDPVTALGAVIVVVVWQFSGYSMVIFLAGLEGIPQDILDAASVDGASAFKSFWHIKRRLLAPAFAVSITLSMVGSLKIFDQVWALTQGGPANATQSVSTLIYQNGFEFNMFGYSVALAVILAIVVAAVGFFQYRILLKGQR
jgi:raffinose/stachyose/melibiose transport system permease protein